MIESLIKLERVDTDTLNTISDKCSHITITNCKIDGAFFSNINSLIYLGSNDAPDTIFVLRDDARSRCDANIAKGFRPVSIVSGYAYTHQITSNRRLGV